MDKLGSADSALGFRVWGLGLRGFQKVGVPSGGLKKRDCTILGSILGSPFFGNLRVRGLGLKLQGLGFRLEDLREPRFYLVPGPYNVVCFWGLAMVVGLPV